MQKFLTFLAAILIMALPAFAGDKAMHRATQKGKLPALHKTALLAPFTQTKAHKVGNIWLSVTNFGQFGNEGRRPSCEFPANSNIEYLFTGAIWIGALVDRPNGGVDTLVSFGFDGWQDWHEMFPGFTEKDSIAERSIRPNSPNFSAEAISEQDYVAVYSDTNIAFAWEGHQKPLGVKITQKSYAWSYSYAEDFVIFDYLIENISRSIGRPRTFKKLFMGVYIDGDCGYTGISNYYADDITGFLRVNNDGDTVNVAWIKDNDGDNGLTPGVSGVRVLFPDPKTISYNWWDPPTDWGPTDPNNPNDYSGHPDTDAKKYRIMSNGAIDPDQTQSNPPAGINASGMDTRYFLSFGPFEVPPDSTLKLTLAYIGGQPEGENDEFDDLGINARWARDVYDNPPADGKPDFSGPPPPDSPNMEILPRDKTVTIRWDNSSEDGVDKFSRLKDFEGYRVYRSRTGVLNEMELLGEYDRVDGFGYDFGFGALNPTTDPNTKKIWYTYTDRGLVNGEFIYYAVTAFDSGYGPTGLEPLESSPVINLKRVAPSAGPEQEQALQEVIVVPNPYRLRANYAHIGWERGTADTDRRIDFTNLPPKCTIRIYSLAGDLLDTIEHDYPNRSAIRHSESWNLVTRNIQAIASGIYLFTVTSEKGTYVGKFAIIY
jgi:hypothetical protein